MRNLMVSDLMSKDVVTLAMDEDLDLADTIMHLGRIRHLPVVKDGVLVGLVSHRDLLRAQASALHPECPDTRKVSVREIMTTGVASVRSDTPALEAAKTIYQQKLGCLAVVDEGRLVGILTEADFVRLVIEGLEDRAVRAG